MKGLTRARNLSVNPENRVWDDDLFSWLDEVIW